MNAIVITSLVVAGTLLLGALIAVVFGLFSNLIDRENEKYGAQTASYQPAVSFGHMIPLEADLEAQLEEARKLAARRAANMPRGANAIIGQSGGGQQKTSFDGIDSDPVSAVRMAHFHGWTGLRTGVKGTPAIIAPVKGVAEAVASVKGSDELVPGKDYPYIEITDDMAPAEKRKARIANAKAKSAAAKAAKASGAAAGVPASETAIQTVAAIETPAPATVGEARGPMPGVDYEVIAITDEMTANEVRSARIANAKAKSAANKKFKSEGGVSAPVAPEVTAVQEPTAPQPPKQVAESSSSAMSIEVDIPAPNYVEITDDMDNDQIRQARIQNAKEKSAYNKALRAAGIDPKTVG